MSLSKQHNSSFLEPSAINLLLTDEAIWQQSLTNFSTVMVGDKVTHDSGVLRQSYFAKHSVHSGVLAVPSLTAY